MKNRIKKLLAATTVVAGLAAGFWAGFGDQSIAGGETRTISLYHIHTKENLTITYMENGRYVPSAMKKINWFMRDWRAKKSVRMDPKTIDLIWELHADLGSKKPIHVVCGLRTGKTNSFLKRIGRGVARKSQHVLGKAIDIYFPDVSTKKMRNSALVRKVGGVGYYSRSGGPTGFLHVDSGKVRHWGPRISQREMAGIFKQYKKTIGARYGKGFKKFEAPQPEVLVAKAEKAPDIAYEGADEDMAELTEAASQSQAAKPEDPNSLMLPAGEVKGAEAPAAIAAFVPKPRQKPLEVLALAAANMHIEPASAPPETQKYAKKKISPVSDSMGAVEAADAMIEPTGDQPVSNLSTKTSFAAAIKDGTADGAPLLKPLTASLYDAGIEWGDLFSADQAIRQDGKPQFSEEEMPVVPKPAKLKAKANQQSAPGKGDLLVVNRDGKGGLPEALSVVLQGRKKLGSLN